jgi:hypothetical protein
MANQYTKLFINNQEIDLFKAEELPLNITKRVNNIEGEIQGDYSRASVSVPATSNNVLILGDSRQFFDFRIEVDGQPSFNGTARVRKGKTFSQGYAAIKETFEINLISNNSSWFVLLGETMLSSLTDLVVTFSQANILAGFVSDPSLREHGFTFIKLKEWLHPVGVAPNIRYQLSLLEATPVLYIKPLIEKAFNSIGYTIQSDFFDTDMFKKLVLPTFLPKKMPFGYNEKYLNTKVSHTAPFTINAVANPFIYDTIDQAAPQNPTAYNTLTGKYTCPVDGYYEIIISWTFGSPFVIGPGDSLIAVLNINGLPTNPLVGFGWPQLGGQYPANETLTASTIVLANAGDTISTVIGVGTAAVIPIDKAEMIINGEAIIKEGVDIDFKFLLENYSFRNFFSGIIAMFNLSIETNEVAKVVTIEPKDNYFNTSRTPTTTEIKEGFYGNTQKDYSQLIDYSKSGSFDFPEMEGSFNYTFVSDSDPTADFVEGINDFKIYEARFLMGEGSNPTKIKSKEIPFFAKTIHVSDFEATAPDSNAVPQFALIYPTNFILDPTATEERTDIKPRILYFAGQRTGGNFPESDGYIELFEAIGVLTPNPISFMVNYTDRTGLDPNLGFDTQIINGASSSGLLQKFYLQELTRNNIAELRKNYVQFNSIDYLNFTHRTKAFIDGERYIVQTLEGFNPLKDAPTQFVFYKDEFPDSDNILQIQNSPLLGVVTLLSS